MFNLFDNIKKKRKEFLFNQTMAKVICAVLRYTDNEKSLIIEQEKLRQSVSQLNYFILIEFFIIQRWLNSTR